METKHTPGPWAKYGGVIRSVVGNDRKVADARVLDDEGQANAKLIAAAPDLLTALQGLLTAYEDPDNTGSTHDDKVLAARNAIAKATT